MSKRTSLKGRGADIFTDAGTPAKQHTSMPAQQPFIKSTYYLTPSVVEGLDEIWLKVRKAEARDKKLTKSAIVARVLGKAVENMREKSAEEIIKVLG